MKSNIKKSIAKSYIDNAMTFIKINDDLEEVLFSNFARDIIYSQITSNISIVRWIIMNRKIWVCEVRTLGGADNKFEGSSINECILKINSFYNN